MIFSVSQVIICTSVLQPPKIVTSRNSFQLSHSSAHGKGLTWFVSVQPSSAFPSTTTMANWLFYIKVCFTNRMSKNFRSLARIAALGPKICPITQSYSYNNDVISHGPIMMWYRMALGYCTFCDIVWAYNIAWTTLWEIVNLDSSGANVKRSKRQLYWQYLITLGES